MFAVFLVFLDVTDSVFKRVWRLNNKDTGCSYIWNEFSFKDFARQEPIGCGEHCGEVDDENRLVCGTNTVGFHYGIISVMD